MNILNAPNQQQGRSVRVNRQRRRRGRSNPVDSVGKYASDAWSLAKRTAYGLNEIRKLINVETKFFDVNSSVSADSSGTVISLSTLAQGLDVSNRIGDSIKLQDIFVNLFYTIGTTATKTVLRAVVFRDLDGYGTSPTVANVLTGGVYLAPPQFLNKDRFSILYDEFVTMQSVNDTDGVTIFHMPHEGHIKYFNTTAASTSNGKGSLYLLLISNESAGTNSPTVNYSTRITYTDD